MQVYLSYYWGAKLLKGHFHFNLEFLNFTKLETKVNSYDKGKLGVFLLISN